MSAIIKRFYFLEDEKDTLQVNNQNQQYDVTDSNHVTNSLQESLNARITVCDLKTANNADIGQVSPIK